MGKSSSPPPPDPYATAQAQTQSNIATAQNNAQLNRVNTYTPYGSLVYDNSGSGGGSSGGGMFGVGGGGYGGSGGGGSGSTQGQFDLESSLLNPGGAGADYFGLPNPFGHVLGNNNSTPIQDIRRAQSRGIPITDDQWAQAGLPPGGGTFGLGGGGGSGSSSPSGYSATVSLSPQEQYLYERGAQNRARIADTAGGMLGQVQNSYANPIDVSGAPRIASSVQNNGPGLASTVHQDGGTTREAIQNAQDAAYRSQTQYLDPQYARAQPALENKLANQGITDTGSEAYKNAMNTFNEGKTQAYGAAQNSATAAGQAEQARLYGQALSDAQLQNQANQQGFGQGLSSAMLQNQGNQQYMSNLFALRNQPLNEYNALASGSQVQNPTFPGVPQTQQANTNTAGIFQDNFTNQIANQNSQNSQRNNAAATAAMMAAMFL